MTKFDAVFMRSKSLTASQAQPMNITPELVRWWQEDWDLARETV